MTLFIVQFADGYFLAERPLCATPLAAFALRLDYASAFEYAARVRGARVCEMLAYGTYAAEYLLDRVVPLASRERA